MTQHASYQRAAASYRNAAVTTSPLTSVVMLYDGVIAELSRTSAAIQQRKFEQAFGHLTTATAILRGLCHNLDFARGGAFAERMRDTYVRLILSALNAFGKPDELARFNKLIGAVTGLRDAWVEVRIQQAKTAGRQP